MSDPKEVYEAIFNQLTNNRTKKSLEAIQEVCLEQKERGSGDFRIVTIAKLGSGRGVPSAQTIRNRTGEHYRALIAAWQATVDKNDKKKSMLCSGEYAWIEEINDSRLRYLALDLVAKVKHTSAENRALKSLKNLEIDYRSAAKEMKLPELYEHERDALKAASDENFLNRQGWEKDSRGSVKDREGKTVFKNGFINAIEKILSVNKTS